MAIKEVSDVLDMIIGWEEQMEETYGELEISMESERSRKLVGFLKDRQAKALIMYKNIDVDQYVDIEYIKNIPACNDIIETCVCKISKDDTPDQVFDKVMTYEENIEIFYDHLRKELVYDKSKELFDMLVKFKLGQIKGIKRFMDDYELAI